MIRFQSELAEFCEKSAKNRVLRAHSYPKKAPSVSDRYLPLSLAKRDRDSTLWNCFFRSLVASADQLFCPELSENDPTLAQIVHLAGTCNAQQKRMIVAFIQMLQAEEYGENK